VLLDKDDFEQVRLESTISGETASLIWSCLQCRRDWPVTEGERRAGPADRRRTSRSDRRKK
jgi:hypothetical protein